jgi:threonine/homoserine efflux transporter RhtA
MGLLLLGERLSAEQWVGIAAVISASLGTTLGDRRAELPPPT